MTKSTKSAKIVLTLLFALLICVAVAVVGTYSALQASKTATGTVTFNLADYDVSISGQAEIVGDIYPGGVATSDDMRIVNSANADDVAGGGTTEGLGPVFVAIKINSITVGGSTVPVSCATSTDSNYLTLGTSNGLEIRLRASAAETGGLTWAAAGTSDASRINLSAPLDFTMDLENGPAAVMQFQVAMAEPTDVNNGFNSDTTGNQVNQYQGKSVSISYTIYWGTTKANLNSVYPTA